MTRFRTREGWLLYAGPIGVIAGGVLHADLSIRTSTIDVTSAFSPGRQFVPGLTEITFTAELTPEKIRWDKNPVEDQPQPDLKALLALACNHPAEYAELHERENVMRALGG